MHTARSPQDDPIAIDDGGSAPPRVGAAPTHGRLTGSTRRTFIRDVAVAGASTAAAIYGLDEAGLARLLAEDAEAALDPRPLSQFGAIGATPFDTVEVPPGFRYQVLIREGDQFAHTDGTVFTFGYNCDYLHYYPLNGSQEGLLFINHEYPDPFLQHGYKVANVQNPAGAPPAKHTKSINDVNLEKASVGNSFVHIRRNAEGLWAIVSPSPYNRRVFAGDIPGMPDTELELTGPLAIAGAPGSSAPDPKVHGATNRAPGSLGNCSGGTTPWGTALSCEENYDGYGITFMNSNLDFANGWDFVGMPVGPGVQQDGSVKVTNPEYIARTAAADESRRYGWVCEHDPYATSVTERGRKHTALGRFRHENTAFAARPNKKFVLYMGDDQANQGVYKFISTRMFDPAGTPTARAHNLLILTQGTLYVARWQPEGRRRFAAAGSVTPLTAPNGTGTWVPVDVSDLFDTRLRLGGFNTDLSPSRRPKQGTAAGDTDSTMANFAGRYNRDVDIGGGTLANEWDTYFACNRPEDVEVDAGGAVWIAMTNNSSVNDSYGSLRRVLETGNDPEALTFTWQELTAGGPAQTQVPPGQRGFASPDNLVFDGDENIWIVTDISSSVLNVPGNPSFFHGNNAVFMLPSGSSTAYRFANMPIHAEGTGPYFTPDEQTLFVNVQHPGEESKALGTSVFGDPSTYTSYWPAGNKSTGTNPSTPRPSTIAISRVPVADPTPPPTDRPVPTPDPVPVGPVVLPPPAPDAQAPGGRVTVGQRSLSVAAFARDGLPFEVRLDEPGEVVVRLVGRVRTGARGRGRSSDTTREITLGTTRRTFPTAGSQRLRVRPSRSVRAMLRRRGTTIIGERLSVTLEDRAGNRNRLSRTVRIG